MKMRERVVEIFRIIYLLLCAVVIVGTTIGFSMYATKSNINSALTILSVTLMVTMLSLAAAMVVKKLIVKPLKHILNLLP